MTNMTVAEFIEFLKTLPQNYEIQYDNMTIKKEYVEEYVHVNDEWKEVSIG